MPFELSSDADLRFTRIMKGDTLRILREWHRDHYVNAELLEVMGMMLRYEDDRVSLDDLRKCSWFESEIQSKG